MSKNNTQQGSAHVVIIIVLIVAVIGLLGYVAWNAFFNKKADNTSSTAQIQQTQQAEQVPLDEQKTVTNSAGPSLSFSYPSSWKITEEDDTKGYVAPADGSLKLHYSLKSLGAIGGLCAPSDDTYTISALNWAEQSTIKGALYTAFVAKNIENANTSYSSFIGLDQDTDAIRTAKTGSLVCDVFPFGSSLIPTETYVTGPDGGEYPVVLSLYVEFTGESKNPTTSQADAEALLLSENAEIASHIIQVASLK
ncbi:MAG: hypothetical protein WAQ27_03675 [Candidatus Microsaccharimonas sp.]